MLLKIQCDNDESSKTQTRHRVECFKLQRSDHAQTLFRVKRELGTGNEQMFQMYGAFSPMKTMISTHNKGLSHKKAMS